MVLFELIENCILFRIEEQFLFYQSNIVILDYLIIIQNSKIYFLFFILCYSNEKF